MYLWLSSATPVAGFPADDVHGSITVWTRSGSLEGGLCCMPETGGPMACNRIGTASYFYLYSDCMGGEEINSDLTIAFEYTIAVNV